MRVETISLKEMQSVWERNRIAGAPRSPELLELVDVIQKMAPRQPLALLPLEGEDLERYRGLIRRAAKILDKTVSVVIDAQPRRVLFEVVERNVPQQTEESN